MTTAAIIVAAGRGLRTGREVPKQYLPIGGVTVLRRSVEAILAAETVDRLIVVIHPADRDRYDAAMLGLDDPRVGSPVEGGATRSASVLAGLEALADDPPKRVLIHDAARPFVSQNIVESVIHALDESDGALAALPVVDALWRAENRHASQPVSRENLWRAQTPQGFQYAAIVDAYRSIQGDFADDVAVARAAGLSIAIVEGSEKNNKITTEDDILRAEREIASEAGK